MKAGVIMFEFFIAFFGGIYILGKCASEKGKQRASNQKYADRLQLIQGIEYRYTANSILTEQIKNYISSGKYFEDICNTLHEDFEYIFGRDWKRKIMLPTSRFIRCDFTHPARHEYWVYHLLLATYGKMDSLALSFGYHIGYTDTNTIIKFAERIEKRLREAGADNIRLVLERESIGGQYRQPDNLCGGRIKIESICLFPTYRLWKD